MKTSNLQASKNQIAQLQLIHDDKIRYRGEVMFYEILGRLSIDFTDLTVMLVAIHDSEFRRYRRKINLFSADSVGLLSQELAELTGIDPLDIERDLERLTDLLEVHREENLFHTSAFHEKKSIKKTRSNKTALELLNLPDLFDHIDLLLEKAGVIGEKKQRLALFLVATSYKNQTPLQGVLCGAENTGKLQLADSIAACIPQEELLALTRITHKSLYYFPSEMLHQKLLVIHELDNLESPAFLALRELQETNQLTLGTTRRDRFGNLVPALRKVEARFSSIITTSPKSTSVVNSKNVVLFKLEESADQTMRLIAFQNRYFSGDLDDQAQQEAKATLHNLIDLIQSKKVVNPYAAQIELSSMNPTMQHMHAQFMILISQVTLLYQFQRKTDSQGRLIVELSDIVYALDIFEKQLFSACNYSSSSTGQFLDQLVQYLETRTSDTAHFTSTEIRHQLGYSKAFVFRAFDALQKAGFINICGGTSNKGFHYQLAPGKLRWQNQHSILSQVKEQVAKLNS